MGGLSNKGRGVVRNIIHCVWCGQTKKGKKKKNVGGGGWVGTLVS